MQITETVASGKIKDYVQIKSEYQRQIQLINLTRKDRTTAASLQTPGEVTSGQLGASDPTCPQTGGTLCSEKDQMALLTYQSIF